MLNDKDKTKIVIGFCFLEPLTKTNGRDKLVNFTTTLFHLGKHMESGGKEVKRGGPPAGWPATVSYPLDYLRCMPVRNFPCQTPKISKVSLVIMGS